LRQERSFITWASLKQDRPSGNLLKRCGPFWEYRQLHPSRSLESRNHHEIVSRLARNERSGRRGEEDICLTITLANGKGILARIRQHNFELYPRTSNRLKACRLGNRRGESVWGSRKVDRNGNVTRWNKIASD
jgi:hypothetical protein